MTDSSIPFFARLPGRLAQQAREKTVSRRGFLMTAFGGSLAFGFVQSAEARFSLPTPLPTAPEEVFEPTIWCGINPDGFVWVNIAKAEMGQHIGTALAQILTDEMEADWDSVRIEMVDTHKKYYGNYLTGGSLSVWTNWDKFRQAGAAARLALVEAAASLFGVSAEACTARKGRVYHGEKSLSFGEIVAQAKPTRQFTAEEMAKLPLKPASERSIIGRKVPALDIPQKITGQAVYGIDANLDGMVYARPKLPPTRYDCKVLSVDDGKARQVPGYERYVILDDSTGSAPGWVMAIASTWMGALQAADALEVIWSPSPAAHLDDAALLDRAKQLVADPKAGATLYDDPGVSDRLKKGPVLKRSYTTAPVNHFTLEPVNASARKVGDIWEIHSGTQCQDLTLPILSKALGVPKEKIMIRTYFLGGGFGRRSNADYTVPAALTSKALGGRPIKMLLTRPDDMKYDSVRSPYYQPIEAALDRENKKIVAMDYTVVAGWPLLVIAPGLMAKGKNGAPYDPFSVNGADSWYDVGAFRLRAINNDLAQKSFRPGWLRAVSAGNTPWALETFMDEAAHELGVDPVEFRLSMLDAEGRNAGSAPNSIGGAHRQTAVLKRVAELCGWGKTECPPDTALGIACTMGQDRAMPTWIATAVQIHVNRQTGAVACQKMWVVVDAGTLIDPDGALAQIQGGSLWGLSMALYEGTRFENGTVTARNLDNYTPLRLNDTPEMTIEFMQNDYTPMGLGEPGVTPVAPAIGNALFNAVGIRLRHIPMRPEDVLAALRAKEAADMLKPK